MLALRASCGLKAARSEAAASARSRLRGRARTGRRLSSSSSSSSKISSFSSDDVEGGGGTSFPVFEKMAGEWEDSVRYVHATMEETPRVKLTGTREIRVTQDGAVTLRSSTVFPNGKTLELSFVGTRVSEAFGLKDVVKFERVPLEGQGQEAPQAAGYYPIVLLYYEGHYRAASEHPALDDQPGYDAVVVREVLAESGRVLLSETITLLPGRGWDDNTAATSRSEGGDAGEGAAAAPACPSALEAVHSAQEVQEDGSLGGVQLWRSRKVS